MSFLYVGIGGGIGAVFRYAISLIPLKTDFPILTLITNLIGAVIIGFVVGLFSNRDNTNPNMVLLLKTGVCGGFTTFSTFSLESITLINNKMYIGSAIYIIASVLLCLAGVVIGEKISMIFK